MPLALLRSSHERLAREGFGFANVVPGQSRVRHRVVDVAGENVIAQLAIDAQPLLQGRHSILCGAGVKERRAEIQVRRAQLPAQAELPAYGDRFLERIQRVRVASLNHCDHASDRQSVAEVHWVCALARQLQRGRREVHCQEGAGRKVFHATQRGLEDGELQGGPHAEVFGFGQPLGGTPNGRIGEPSQGLDPEDASIGQVDDGLERQPDADPVHQEPDTLGEVIRQRRQRRGCSGLDCGRGGCHWLRDI